ncbi:hypothetical protein ACFXKW_21120 [Streptomyces sp. NPDC059193]|uniref:hypothetical protein n=1 Tax=Streptomyces sp. NPDC059193 TaxID=3346763 RepID=UPI00368D37B6
MKFTEGLAPGQGQSTASAAPGELAPWRPPAPGDLPEWRTRMREYLASQVGLLGMAGALNSGRASLLPTVPGLDASPGAIGAQLLHREESERLRRADLYYVTGDMVALTLAAAATVPREKVHAERLPSPAGLMVFEEPIGGYTAVQESGGAAVTMPIVAVSWGEWTPHGLGLDRGRVRWIAYPASAQPRVIPDTHSGVWATFWTPNDGAEYAGMDPAEVVAVGPDGVPVTAGELAAMPQLTPLGWDNETLLGYGAGFETPKPDTCDEWVQAVYTAWQLITQGGSRLTDREDIPRARAGRKRDARDGIAQTADVRVINVHANHRPARAATDADAADSSGRRAPSYSHRWPVRPHRRDHCMSPRTHAAKACTHEERIIPAHIKGPADAPLRVRDTVKLWDHQPDGDDVPGQRS